MKNSQGHDALPKFLIIFEQPFCSDKFCVDYDYYQIKCTVDQIFKTKKAGYANNNFLISDFEATSTMFKLPSFNFVQPVNSFQQGPCYPSDQTDLLHTAFTQKYNYQQMCMIMLQILAEAHLDPSLLQDIHKRLLAVKKINHKINLQGKLQQPSDLKVPTHNNPVHLRLFISSFQNTLAQQNIIEEKKVFIKSAIKQKIEQLAKSALHVNYNEDTKKSRFRRDFKRKNEDLLDSQEELTIESLIQAYSLRNKYVEHDIVLSYKLLKTMFGHNNMDEEVPYSPIYNVLYDKSGKLILTADEEGLIKIWSSETGTLIYNLKGHTGYIEQLHVTECNRYLVSCGSDGIRIWSLTLFTCLAVLCFRRTIITISSYTKNNETVICFIEFGSFYQIHEKEFLNNKGRQIQTYSLMKCCRINKNKHNQDQDSACSIAVNQEGYTLIGFQSGELVILDKKLFYSEEELPKSVVSKEHAHRILEIQWNKKGKYFITGSQDGTCRLWEFNLSCFEENKIKSIATIKVAKTERRKRKRQPYCSCISWTCQGNYILAAFGEKNENGKQDEKSGQGQIIVFDFKKMKILHQVKNKLPYKLDIVNVLQPHPLYENIAMFCQSNGRIVVFDITTCHILNLFQQRGFHVEHPQFTLEACQGKFNPNGDNFAISTEYGSISIYGYGVQDFYHLSFTEQFFANDFELFVLDQNMAPMLIDTNIDVNRLQRNKLYSNRKNQYEFEYNQQPQELMKKGYFCQQYKINHIQNLQKYELEDKYIMMVQNQLEQFTIQEERFVGHHNSIQALCKLELFTQEETAKEQLKQILSQQISQFNKLSEQKLNIADLYHQNVVPSTNHIKHTRLRKIRNANIKLEDMDIEFDEQQYQNEENSEEAESDNASDDESQYPKRRSNRRNRSKYAELSESFEQVRTSQRVKRDPAISIHELEESYQKQIEKSIPKKKKKKLHIGDQDDEQVYVNQEQKKMIQVDQYYEKIIKNQDLVFCKRCQIEASSYCCKTCKDNYCSSCRQFRGKQIEKEFQCFHCFFKNNINLNEQRNAEKRVLQQQTRDPFIYIPQIGDEVYFFFQGYEEFIMKHHEVLNPKCLQLKNQFRLIEFDVKSELRMNPLCEIKSLEYIYPLKYYHRGLQRRDQPKQRYNQMLILLELEAIDLEYTFYVIYVVNYVDYIVRKELLDYTHQNDLINKIKLGQRLNCGDEQYQVIEKVATEKIFQQSAWKFIKVKDFKERLRRNRASNDIRINVWRITSLIPPIEHYSSIKFEDIKRMLESIARLKRAKPELMEYFYEDVDTKTYKDYNGLVQVSVSLYKIEKRLKNSYYRSKQSLIFDIKRIQRNSTIYNGDDSAITKQAEQLQKQLLKIVESETIVIYQPSNHHHPQIEQVSKQAVTKPKATYHNDYQEDKDEYLDQDQDFIETRRMTRSRQPQNKQIEESSSNKRQINESGILTRNRTRRTFYRQD